MVVIAATGSGSLIASNMFTGSVRRPGSFLSSISSYLNGIGVSPETSTFQQDLISTIKDIDGRYIVAEVTL